MSNKSTASVAVQEPMDHSVELGHGNSPAAWTSVAVMLVGVLVGCIAFLIGESAMLLFWIGVGIIAVGVILGPVLKAAGYGVGGSKLKSNGH
ncbi:MULTISPECIES: HGxxPAAW family protein [Arthrobacter]|uniref:HGxxPAAW family protein n=1 Tax=unclassified Arthrobacter TaxID=235627 RepID=UPI0024BB17C5|nr:HGxxPAAW family protein [Arthrobacter sp. H35-MC1]MDJ0318059.1 HGxxPAAW family protein [Arthrobacter sp. H35-MC1]